jgi:hypothetical protein
MEAATFTAAAAEVAEIAVLGFMEKEGDKLCRPNKAS